MPAQIVDGAPPPFSRIARQGSDIGGLKRRPAGGVRDVEMVVLFDQHDTIITDGDYVEFHPGPRLSGWYLIDARASVCVESGSDLELSIVIRSGDPLLSGPLTIPTGDRDGPTAQDADILYSNVQLGGSSHLLITCTTGADAVAAGLHVWLVFARNPFGTTELMS